MSKQFWTVVVVIILVFLGIAVYGGKGKSGKTSSSSASLTQHITGSNKTGVTLVEYGDYECPYCQAYEPTVKQVVSQFSDQIYFQFRNFPLTNAHRNAFAAARAAEAAGLQGSDKFWQMHDALYESSRWQVWVPASDPTVYFNQYAQEIGLNAAQFKTDFASSKVNDLINADTNYGNALGVDGTPAFFLDGKKVQIANNVDAFVKIINAEISLKQSSAKQ